MRLFICDPVCALPFGHNAVALSYFKTAYANRFSESIALCGKELPERMAKAHDFIPFFQHYYDDFIRLDHRVRTMTEPVAELNHVDRLESRATRDAERLLRNYNIDDTDVLLYPSTDFYGLIGLLNALDAHPATKRPRILLRFIGVMETATHAYRDPMRHLATQLRKAISSGARFSLSAETPRLASILSVMLDATVLVTPYPEVSGALGAPDPSCFLIFCPGAARFDKGFLHLLDLFTMIRQSDLDLKIRFVTQTLSERDAEHHQNYISKLYALPGVELLSSSISSDEMRRHYRRCSLVLLPYDTGVYRDRGSAVLMEAACLGRPVLTVTGSAFAEQVTYYRLGTVVPSINALAAAATELAGQDSLTLYRKALHARDRFVLDVLSSHENWLRGGR
jgi:glycosyltransferase involved in cell wall biosynthesis